MMDRALPFALAFLLAAPVVAHADGESIVEDAGLTDVAAGTSGCPSCKLVKTKKVKGLGTARLYRSHDADGDWTQLVLVVTGTDGKAHAASPIDISQDCAMGGKCAIPGKITAKLRAITVGGKPAAALDVDAQYFWELTDMDTGTLISSREFHERTILACTAKSCQEARVGGPYEDCHATLTDDGHVVHACDSTTDLFLD